MSVFRKLLKVAYAKTLNLLEYFEQRDLPTSSSPLRPIFILGAPRSGTTLTYQIITHSFDVGYFSNLHALFYTNPAFIQKIIKYLPRHKSYNFHSSHGRIRGLTAPSEAGAYWYRFFRKSPQHVSLKEIDEQKMKAMVHSLKRFQRATNKPIIIKNLPITVRLEVIQKYIPDAIFIVVRRDTQSNIHSILNARQKSLGRTDVWWSVETPNIDELASKAPEEQVLGQITTIHHLIEKAKQSGNGENFFDLNYEDLCKNPKDVMDALDVFFKNQNLPVAQFSLPPLESFTVQPTKPLSEDLSSKVKNLLKTTA